MIPQNFTKLYGSKKALKKPPEFRNFSMFIPDISSYFVVFFFLIFVLFYFILFLNFT